MRSMLGLHQKVAHLRGPATLISVQLLRALAALLVAGAHMDQVFSGAARVRFGEGAIDMFFVLSGFIMVYVTDGQRVGGLGFLLNRVRRVVPLYWLFTMAMVLLALLAPQLLHATRADPAALAMSLLFVPFAKTNGLTQPVLYVGWTLNYEMFFYVIFAIALSVARGLSGPGRTSTVERPAVGISSIAAVVALCLITCVAIGRFGPFNSVILNFYCRAIVLNFLFGIGAGALYVSGLLPGRQWPSLFPSILIGASLAGLICLPEVWPRIPGFLTAGVPACGILWGALLIEERIGRIRWICGVPVGLGSASYAIYLSHTFVIEAFAQAGRRLELTPPAMSALEIPCFVAICVTGMLVHLMIERPVDRSMRWMLPDSRARRAPAVLPHTA